jgi:hypothetical protein
MAKTREGADARPSPIETLRTEITAVAAQATAADMELVDQIIARARAGKRDVAIYTVSPAAMALIWLRYNPHNRDTRPIWVREIARRMNSGAWVWNNEAAGFYTTGNLSDAGHRFAGGAIAGYTWTVAIVFGIDQSAITSIDDGKARHAYEASKLTGMQLASLKERVLRQGFAYLKKWKSDIELPPIGSVAEMHAALARYDGMLSTAIEIGDASFQNVVNPVLKKGTALASAFVLLWGRWPEQRVAEKLAALNQGTSSLGESDPVYVAGEAISDARKKADPKARLTTNREIGVVLLAINMSETGVKATKKPTLLATVRKELPDPTYKGDNLSPPPSRADSDLMPPPSGHSMHEAAHVAR